MARITNIQGSTPTGRTEGLTVERGSGFMASPALAKITQRWHSEGTFVAPRAHAAQPATQAHTRALAAKHA